MLTNPFPSFLCIDSIKTFRFEPFAPIADNKAFKRLVFAISRFEVVGVEGVLTCGVVGFLPCKRPSVERRGKLVWLYGELVWLWDSAERCYIIIMCTLSLRQLLRERNLHVIAINEQRIESEYGIEASLSI